MQGGRTRSGGGGLVLLLLAWAAAAWSAEDLELALVVSAEWQATEIELTTLSRIYLGRRTHWSGQRVQPLNLPADSGSRSLFEREVLGLSARELERYWIDQALRGGPLPPRERQDARAVIHSVRAHPGRIGYVPRAELAGAEMEGVRVLAIRVAGGSLRPGDEGYPLRSGGGGR